MLVKDFLTLPPRSKKPRDAGLTLVLDKGIGLRQVEDLLASASDYVDLVKLGWGTGYLAQDLRDKIKLYQGAGIPVYFGGTFLELALVQGRFDDFRALALSLGLSHVEVSTGVIELSVDEKTRYIRELARDFVVVSEVGSKSAQKVLPAYKWIECIQAELDAGAWKVICEGRESGTVGLFHTDGEVKSGVVDEIVSRIDPARLIFEAPQKAQQVWFIQKFGSDVNLGNIATSEVIPLETLRLGLRADTMGDFHDVKAWNDRSQLSSMWADRGPTSSPAAAARTKGTHNGN
jgi:phosphosulfolactate synthase